MTNDTQDGASDARKLEVNGWVCAIGALFIPLMGLAGLILGAILAGKPGKAGKGITIITCSILLGLGSSIFWYEHFVKKAEGESQSNGPTVQYVTPNGE